MREVLPVQTQCPEHVAWWRVCKPRAQRGWGRGTGLCPLVYLKDSSRLSERPFEKKGNTPNVSFWPQHMQTWVNTPATHAITHQRKQIKICSIACLVI